MGDPNVEFIGEIGEKASEFLGNAYAYIFPIDWPEPFGLTMIEAMACGTPTIAFNRGSVPEVMQEGLTGFIVDNMDEAVAAVEKIASIERTACRNVLKSGLRPRIWPIDTRLQSMASGYPRHPSFPGDAPKAF